MTTKPIRNDDDLKKAFRRLEKTLVLTELSVIRPEQGRFALMETAGGVSIDEVIAATEARLEVDPALRRRARRGRMQCSRLHALKSHRGDEGGHADRT